MVRIKQALIILCALSLSDCRKQSNEHTIPAVSVNIEIDVNLPQYNDLNFIGGCVYLKGGYNGIIAYRQTLEIINAYERQAPYKVADGCKVMVDSVNISVLDTCSGSEWLLYDGQITKGPAASSLRQYQTYFDGLHLSITN